MLQRGAAEVHTVEHLLAALLGLQLDNLEIELTGPELPSLDGSSLPWYEALARAGIVELKSPRKTLELRRAVSVELDGATLTAMPSERPGLHLSYTLDYSAQGLPPQYVEAHVPGSDLAAEVAPARTFVFAAEAEALQKSGLGQGAHGGNTVVIDAQGRPTEGRLRFPDEPARHKLLDLMGDLLPAGRRAARARRGHASRATAPITSWSSSWPSSSRSQQLTGRATPATAMDIREITQLLPHRYPFLLVDRVLELEGYRRAVGIKNVTVNEPFFMGHFPGNPVMPGVLILEAMAQLAGTLLLRRMEYTGKLPVLWAIDKVKLRRSVVPGDQLRLEVEATKVRDTMGKVDAIAKVDQHIAAEAQLTFTLVDAG